MNVVQRTPAPATDVTDLRAALETDAKSLFQIEPRMTVRVGVVARSRDEPGAVPVILDPVLSYLQDLLHDFHRSDRHAPGSALGTVRQYAQDADADLRLVCPLSGPATLEAARVAREAGLPIEAILRYNRQTHREILAPDDRISFDTALESPTLEGLLELDTISPQNSRMARRLAERSVIAHSDLVIYLGDAENPSNQEIGLALQEAKRSGMLVMSMCGPQRICLWEPDTLAVDPAEDGDWYSVVDPEGQQKLRHALARMLGLPETPPSTATPEPSVRTPWGALIGGLRSAWRAVFGPEGHGSSRSEESCLEDFYAEEARVGGNHCGFYTLRWLFTENRLPRWSRHVDYRLDANLIGRPDADGSGEAAAWIETIDHVRQHCGETFAEGFEHILRRRWIYADNLAIHYSNLYRTAYIKNFALSGVAVSIALLSIFLGGLTGLKAIAVVVELLVIRAIIRTFKAEKEGAWHQRWMHYRALAEALRPSRLPALLGNVSGQLALTPSVDPGSNWVAWYVRATFREVPLPSGKLDQDALRRVLKLASEEEIGEAAKDGKQGSGQIAFHTSNHRRSYHLDHNLHVWANRTLTLTIVAGVAFVALYLLYTFNDSKLWKKMISGYKPLATVLGGILPTYGAVFFGIRAVGDFRASAHQSERMVRQLERLKLMIEGEIQDPHLHRTQDIFALLSKTLADDQRVWAMIYAEREVTQGF
ncbi:MAG: hypothetical protein AAGK00_16155 [Pseudomonadota bacterium]